MRIAKWGNSLAVRIPSAVAEELGLKEGDDVKLTRADADLTIEKAPSPLELLERLKRHRGLMPGDFKFDRDEANSRD